MFSFLATTRLDLLPLLRALPGKYLGAGLPFWSCLAHLSAASSSILMRMAKRTQYLKPPVCRPCWELHYCPYDVLVESMPFCDSPDDMKRQKEWGWKEHRTRCTSGRSST